MMLKLLCQAVYQHFCNPEIRTSVKLSYVIPVISETIVSRASIRPIAQGATQSLQELVPVGQRKNNFERQIEVLQHSGDSRPYPLYGRHGTM